MVTRFKLIAAALGLVVAAGTVGDASARIIDRTIVKTTVVTRSAGPVVRVTPRLHRVVVLQRRPVLHRYIAYRAPVVIGAPVVVRTHVVGPRIVRAPILLKRHAWLHQAGVRKTIIR